jgi:hypothetical protein
MRNKEPKPQRKECIFCEKLFTDNSEDNSRDYCYREECIEQAEETGGRNSLELNSEDND